MTRKSIDRLVTAAIDQIIEQTGLNPEIEAKGGEREVANAELYKQLKHTLVGVVERAVASIGPKGEIPSLLIPAEVSEDAA